MMARILLVESSVKLVMRSAMDYADFDDGSNCHPSNERLARETGYSTKTVQFAWSVMRGLSLAERVGRGSPSLKLADDYILQIPSSWSSMPIIGPLAQKFTCPGCEKVFTPQGNCTVNDFETDKPGDDNVRFNLLRITFCPPPRKTSGRVEDPCSNLWSQRQKRQRKKTWAELDAEARWALFREARGDNW